MTLIISIIPTYWKTGLYCFVALLATELIQPLMGRAQAIENGLFDNRLIVPPVEAALIVALPTRKDKTTDISQCNKSEEPLHAPTDRSIDKKVIRDFALFSYSRLSNDIVNGGGTYLDTLFSILQVSANNRKSVLQDFVKIFVSNQRIPIFAMEVAEYVCRK